ncbi:uncharacterized protein [Misgurnus anguillicaudatus]|uniref:uncharacterized protein n=1 Tax=Misgurnus anguillicaudatus TaxID=75329 RepID=UPI003CCFB09B
MSKTIYLVFVLVILTTLLCNSPVCSQRGSGNGQATCGCKIHPRKGLQCVRRPHTTWAEIVQCICNNRKTYLNGDSKRLYQKYCNRTISTPL